MAGMAGLGLSLSEAEQRLLRLKVQRLASRRTEGPVGLLWNVSRNNLTKYVSQCTIEIYFIAFLSVLEIYFIAFLSVLDIYIFY